MAFAIDKTPGVGAGEFYHPSNHFDLADQTATTAAQTLGAAAKSFSWRIWLKAFTKGTGTVAPTFTLEVADNSAFSTNVREIDRIAMPGNYASNALATYFNPDVKTPDGQKAFVRVRVIFSGTDSGTFDVMIDAA